MLQNLFGCATNKLGDYRKANKMVPAEYVDLIWKPKYEECNDYPKTRDFLRLTPLGALYIISMVIRQYFLFIMCTVLLIWPEDSVNQLGVYFTHHWWK
jgi:hypothetical protein